MENQLTRSEMLQISFALMDRTIELENRLREAPDDDCFVSKSLEHTQLAREKINRMLGHNTQRLKERVEAD